MDNQEEWKSKIANFNNLVETSCVDENANEELVFDILQDLFSENIKESTRLQLILLVQQHEEDLIDSIDKAIQVCGSLLNIYDFFSNQLILFKTQVLVTVTGICINFDLAEEAESLYHEFISLLINIVMKVNSGDPLLRKTSSDCLAMFENANQGLLLKYIHTLLTCIKEERTFAVYSHVLVVASVIYNSFENTVGTKDILLIDGINFDVNKSISLLIEGMHSSSAAGLIYMLQRIIPFLGRSKISKAVINNLLLYCLPSWDLCHVYVYIYFHRNYKFVFQDQDEMHITPIISHLTMLLDMNQLTSIQTLIVQYWVSECIQGINSSITYTETYLLTLQAFEPNIYSQLQFFPDKVVTLLQIWQRNSSLNISFDKQTSILHVLICHSKHMHWYDKMSDLFCVLFRLYKYGTASIQEDIIQVVEKLTVGSLKLVMHTVDFCDNIEALKLNNASFNLLTNIVRKLVCIDTKDVLSDLKSYFLIMERVATMEDLCPLNIIKSLKEVTKSLSCEGGSWQDGNLLLSICRNIIIHNNKQTIRYEISSLLWYISQYFPCRYIHDRALSYYLILGKMSPKNYKEIFVSSFLKQPDKAQICEVAEVAAQGPLLVRKLKKNVLTLTWKEHVIKDCLDVDLSTNTNEEIFEAYKTSMTSDSFDTLITHKFILSMETDSPGNIYAIKLELFTNGPFEITQSISCPHLCKNYVDQNTKGEEVTISFKPNISNIASFKIRATFIDEEHNCWITQLKPYHLQFKHLFKPLQHVPSKVPRSQLFQALWSNLENSECSGSQEASLSVKNIGLVSSDEVYKNLDKFIITQLDVSIDVGIYMPPHNHILFKFRFNEFDTVVWIATDGILFLDEIDNYLETLHV